MAKHKKGGAKPAPPVEPEEVDGAPVEERIGIRRAFTVKQRIILMVGAVLAISEAAEKVTAALVEAGFLRNEEDGRVSVTSYVNLRNGAVLNPGAVYSRHEAGARVINRLQMQGDIYTVKRPSENKVATPPENKQIPPKPETEEDGSGDKKPEDPNSGEGGEGGPGEED